MMIVPFRPAFAGRLWSWYVHVRAVLRLPLVRDCPEFRKPTWLSSVQVECSG